MALGSEVDILGIEISFKVKEYLGPRCYQPVRFCFTAGHDGRRIAKPCYAQGKVGRKIMAVSTCAKCSGHSFELALFTPLGESKKLTMVQCSRCGIPIGVLDPAITPQIEALKNQVAAIDEKLNRIAKALQR
jgi:hypothetical protein